MLLYMLLFFIETWDALGAALLRSVAFSCSVFMVLVDWLGIILNRLGIIPNRGGAHFVIVIHFQPH
jgi:hypothetical protein